MRAVALSDAKVQKKVSESFIPLKINIPYGSKKFPSEWAAMRRWSITHTAMGGEKCQGLTGCSVVSIDTEKEFANTGSAFVWELFDSTAYDAEKFCAMLDRGLERSKHEQEILADASLSSEQKEEKLAGFHKTVSREIAKEGRGRTPPKGFSQLKALELFVLSGDVSLKALTEARNQDKK